MSAQFRTPLKIATGLGSAKSGVHHFMAQAITKKSTEAIKQATMPAPLGGSNTDRFGSCGFK